MAIYNPTALDLINSVSLMVNGINANNTTRPTKTEILEELQRSTRFILDKYNWDFLWTRYNTPNYTLSNALQRTYRANNGTTLLSHSNGLEGEVDYYAYDISSIGAALGDTWRVTDVLVKGAAVGVGTVYGTITAMICKKGADGYPDVSNPVTSSTYTIVDNLIISYYGGTLDLSSYKNILFALNYADNDSILLGSDTIYLVMKMQYTTGSGAYVTLLCSGDTTPQLSNINGSGWVSAIGTAYEVRLGISYGNFIVDGTGILTLPEDVDTLTGLQVSGGTMLSQCNSVYAIKDPTNIPTNSWYRYDRTSEGLGRVYINTSVSNVTSFTLTYKKQPTLLVNDTDISDIPPNFRDILVLKAAHSFLSRGYGDQDALNMDALKEEYTRRYVSMKATHLPQVPGSLSVAGVGFVPDYEVSNPYEPNSWRTPYGG